MKYLYFFIFILLTSLVKANKIEIIPNQTTIRYEYNKETESKTKIVEKIIGDEIITIKSDVNSNDIDIKHEFLNWIILDYQNRVSNSIKEYTKIDEKTFRSTYCELSQKPNSKFNKLYNACIVDEEGKITFP